MQTIPRGLFVVVEGIDASGSTTQSSKLAAYLRERGSTVLHTREPSDGPAGMLIRLALTRRLTGPNWATDDGEATYAPFDAHALALLFAADRRDHVTTRVLPALERGHHVVSDRGALSSLAYQGMHSDPEWIRSINRHALTPDLTIFLDLPASEADVRIRSSRLQRDSFEQLSVQQVVQQNYYEAILQGYPELGRIEVVDASHPVDAVWMEVKRLVDDLLDRRASPSPAG